MDELLNKEVQVASPNFVSIALILKDIETVLMSGLLMEDPFSKKVEDEISEKWMDRVRGNVQDVSVCPQNRAYGSVHGSSCNFNPLIERKPVRVFLC